VSIAATAAEAAGATVRVISLRDFALPVYDADFESDYGLLENLRALKRLFNQAEGLLIATPEYNGSFSAALKNTLDWVSRPSEGETVVTMSCFRGKVAGLLSASPGRLGGVRALGHTRDVLTRLSVTTLPEQVSVPHAHLAFDDEGLVNVGLQCAVEDLGWRIARFAAAAVHAHT
jgi:chromate reductase